MNIIIKFNKSKKFENNFKRNFNYNLKLIDNKKENKFRLIYFNF